MHFIRPRVFVFVHRCPPEFVYLYREFGGNLWIRDSRQQLATEITNSNSTTLTLMRELQEQPLSLQSCCRLVIRNHCQKLDDGNRICHLAAANEMKGLLTTPLVDFLLFRSLVLSVEQVPVMGEIPTLVGRTEAILCQIVDDMARETPLIVRRRPREQPVINQSPAFTIEPEPKHQPEPLDRAAFGAPPPPPPPPPPPIAPRPGFWRFPEAELATDHRVWRRPDHS
ncbi:hypothetical protein TCAL_04120 [Tigriopus californicus]|uniref:Uncharacterized protein n=1 Tax=Tigriopus californicus TaxID=6832 RepID=A0A553NU84_TIGCA|nr:hypothetical protein TCAL_04120 [Tigriopus californicus]